MSAQLHHFSDDSGKGYGVVSYLLLHNQQGFVHSALLMSKSCVAQFTRVGVDCFGPFEIKCGQGTIKQYRVIFTCLSVRAVHIEVFASLNTDSFIHALRRFIARRGQVSVLYSDNGTNFVGAERELKEAIKIWNHNKIKMC